MSSKPGRGRGKKRRDDGNGFEEWGGYMQAKIQKLQEQFKAGDPNEHKRAGSDSNIFKGISIFVNGYTNPTSDELKKIMKQHGGMYHHYYSRSYVSHIIATNLPNSKVDNLTDKKVVKPQWICDSVKAGKLLPYQDYLLVTGRGITQPGLFSLKKSSITGSKHSHSDRAFDRKETDGSLDSINEQDVSIAGKNVTETLASAHSEGGSENYNRPGVILSKDSTSICDDNNTSTVSGKDLFDDDGESDEDGQLSPVLPYLGVNRITTAPVSDKSDTVDNLTNITPTTSAAGESDSVQSTAIGLTSSVSDPFRAPAKPGDPSFVAEFYNHSRLHYLSTWGAEFREYVNKLHTNEYPTFPARDNLRKLYLNKPTGVDPEGEIVSPGAKNTGKPLKVIMHIDMDAFFVSVGLRNRPDLIGKPVAVTHSRGKGITKERPGTDVEYEKAHWQRHSTDKSKQTEQDPDLERNPDMRLMNMNKGQGANNSKPAGHQEPFNSMAEIASCSYEARKAGVKKNRMFVGAAKAVCPDLITIPYDFDAYKEVSLLLYDTVASYTHDIEAVSCDEMLVDCTDLLADTGVSPLDFVTHLRKEIKEKTGCNASAGLGPSILLARLATNKAKPNGQFYLESHKVLEFIADKPVSDLPGVGWAMAKKLKQMSIETCGQLQSLALAALQKEFGPKTGQTLHNFCRGIDDRQIKMEKERKSDSEVDKFISGLAEEVHNRMDKINVKGKTVTLKLKVRREGAPKETAKYLGHGICDSITKSVTLPLATDSAKIIAKECMGILRPLKIPADEFRGMGIQVSRLESPVGSNANRGMQSILNFATKLKTPPKSTKQASPVQTPNRTTPAEESDENVSKKAENASESEDKTDVPQENRINDDCMPVSRRTLPPLPILPEMPSPDVSFRLSQVPDGFSPESPGLACGQRVQESPGTIQDTETPKAWKSHQDACDIYVPSPSQVDPDVLDQLPVDIQKQIKQAMALKLKSQAKPLTIADVPEDDCDIDGERAGCSHWRSLEADPGGSSEMYDTAAGNQGIITDLPNMSQLDPSCFEALPKELQKELTSAYEHQREKDRKELPQYKHTDSAVHPLMLPKYRNSPEKSPSKSPRRSPKKSPQKSPIKKKSPIFKVPKAPIRKKKHSAKKLQFLKPKDTSHKLHVNGSEELQAVEEMLNDVNDIENVKETVSVAEESDKEPTKQKPNLCGAISISEVRALMREWIQSCEAPTENDLDQFLVYLGNLVQDKDLEMVDLTLKSLNRITKKKGAESWLGGFNIIQEQTQAFIKSIYGYILKLNL